MNIARPAATTPPETQTDAVLVIDDHRVFADLLTLALEGHPTIGRVDRVSSIEAARDAVGASPIDIAVLDVRLPDGNGLDLIDPLLRHHPRARVIVLTGHPRRSESIRAIDRGASAYLAKDGSFDSLMAALVRARRDAPVITGSFPEDQLAGGTLTVREREVLLALVDGHDAVTIAADLSLSVWTVRDHIKAILAKLHVRSQLEAVARASALGLVPPGPGG